MRKFKIFVVEDDIWYGEMLTYHLRLNPDYMVSLFRSGKACLNNLYEKPDLITIDLSLPDMPGKSLYKKIKETTPNVSVIIVSGQEDITDAVDLVKDGVKDYIVKDKGTKELLWNSINRIRENQVLEAEVIELRDEIGGKFKVEECLIGESEPIKKIVKLMEKAVRSDINVYITGETGTGKEVVARCIHYNSHRKKKKFVPVNMAAIPKELLESELFGHEKGAFTGAIARKTGKFEEANGGTLFLDEIAELDLSIQSKILRVLQEREMTKVGSTDIIRLDIRLIVATHKNLTEEIRKNNFREDLFFRIMGLPIELPPLRNRGNDIILLADYFLELFVRKSNFPVIKINKEAMKKLIQYAYPGNVRELKAIVELAVVVSDNKEITEQDILFTSNKTDEVNDLRIKTLRQHICEIIQYYLNMNGQDITETANILKIGKSTIYKMIKSGEIKTNKSHI
jgi:two-component system, NtrC family, response regulator AtoC